MAETLADYLRMLNIQVLVFSDLSMPQYDEVYALENIRKIDPSAKVIMITGESKEVVNEKVKPLNPTSVFSKPLIILNFKHFLRKFN